MTHSSKPLDPVVRLAIARWPDDAPRGAVTAFCYEHGLSRKTFYKLRRRAREEGQAAVLEPKSRRPKTSPTKINDAVKDQAVQVRLALESSGLDCGPISVFDRMTQMGLTPPSVASLARIFRERDVARVEPRKKPRSAYRRFVYPAPNACWQLDATEYTLTGGRKCVIFQLQDDHSRLAIASHVAVGETSEAALAVLSKGIATHGVPQRLLTDNGIALNPTRRGYLGQLVVFANSLGIETITGKPYKPTTQGKNERFHQTLFRWLDKQPLATSIDEMQKQVDEFDEIYNTQRPHQALPGRVTPAHAYAATPVAQPPTPPEGCHLHPAAVKLMYAESPATQHARVTRLVNPENPGTRPQKVYANGTISINNVSFNLHKRYSGQTVWVSWDHNGISIATADGELIVEYDWPPAKARYVGRNKAKPPTKTHLSPMS